MKSFSTRNGDVVVDKTIEMVDGSELVRQKVERVLGTNKGEWSYDKEEGIPFPVVLRKNPDKDEIRAAIEEALIKIDETFAITEFSVEMENRDATISFRAVNADGMAVTEVYTYAS